MGIDVVSSGEIYTASAAGYPMERAYFHGNNKTDDDVRYAMERVSATSLPIITRR